MAKIRFCVKENNSTGTHSFYAVPLLNGTLTFDELCTEASVKTGIEPGIVQAAVTEYIRTVRRNLLKGFRTQVGKDFLTVYPTLRMSVKDETDGKGRVIRPATARMVNATLAKGRVEAVMNRKFTQAFVSEVNWQKVDATTGAVIEDEDQPNDATV